MSDADSNNSSQDESDLIAAEYVIGLLTAAEAQEVEARAIGDPPLARSILEWQSRLHPMTELVQPVAPPAEVWTRLQGTLGIAPALPAVVAALPPHERGQVHQQLVDAWESVRFWRGMTVVAFVGGAATIGALIVVPNELISRPAVAALTADNVPVPAFLVMVTKNGYATIINNAAEVQPGNSLELWGLPEGATMPIRLGLLPTEGRLRIKAIVPIGSHLLVSREPPGGSPKDGPTGPVVYKGRMIKG